jgi:hypothetical protein
MVSSEVSTSVVKWSVGLSNRLSIVIRSYIDCMRFAVCLALSIIIFYLIILVCILYYFIYGNKLCVRLFDFINYVFLLSYVFLLLCNAF